MGTSNGFFVSVSKLLEKNVVYIRIQVFDIRITLRDILNSLIDISWISQLLNNDYIRTSVHERVEPTVERIKKDFDNDRNPTVNRNTGEKLVSEISRKTLVDDFGHWSIPLAELYKQKVDGNPGFDFHTVEPETTILLYGEAKYVNNSTPFSNAMSQIHKFVNEKKDLKDIYELDALFLDKKPLIKAVNGEKGYIASFSTNGKSDDWIIERVTNHPCYEELKSYPWFYIIAVDLC